MVSIANFQMSQSPLLHVPTRTTDEAEFSSSMRAYIRSHYEQEPDKFSKEINALHRLRQDMRGAGKDLTGRDILYRYYGQLELLDLRFPIDEAHVKILFNWYDSFTEKECGQYSIAFEKASVIYNIAATCTSIAALQNRFEPEGIKLAYNYFQAAAGLFSFINENFLHAPSVDMSRDSIKTLTELALAQAQECFLEKVANLEKKKGNLVSKLAAQVAFGYSNVADSITLDSIRGQFDKSWLELVKVKAKHFSSLAYYHKFIQLETDGKYGLSISHLTLADTLAKEANKLASSFAYNFPSFTVSTMSGAAGESSSGEEATSASTALVNLSKSHLQMLSDKLVVALRDNDMIYHETIPPVDSLEPLEKLNAVKPTSFTDLLPNGQADVQKIVGPDIFIKLVPLSVHEASSMYSEEKAQLRRREQHRCQLADDEVDATIDSLNLMKTLSKLMTVIKDPSSLGEEFTLPQEVMDWSITVQTDEAKGSKNKNDVLQSRIETIKPPIQEMLAEVTHILEKEQHECENMRVKYIDAWTQEPSSKLTIAIRAELKSHKESFEKASSLDAPIISDLQTYQGIVKILNQPLDLVEALFVKEVVTATPPARDVSLLDEKANDGIGALGEQIVIEKIEALLQHLRGLKKERAEIMEEINEKIKTDDISSLLLLNKNKETQIFQTELTKYAPFQSRINTSLESHHAFLKDLTTEFQRLLKTSQAMRTIESRERKKLDVFNDWKEQYLRYKNAKDGLKRGASFYTNLKQSMEELKSKVIEFSNRRGNERNSLVKKIEDEFAERGERALREQIQKLQVSTSQSAGSPPAQVPQFLPSSSPLGRPGSVGPQPTPYSVSPVIHSLPTASASPVGHSIPSGYRPTASPSAPVASPSSPYSYADGPSMPPCVSYQPAYQPMAPPPMSPGGSHGSSNQGYENQTGVSTPARLDSGAGYGSVAGRPYVNEQQRQNQSPLYQQAGAFGPQDRPQKDPAAGRLEALAPRPASQHVAGYEQSRPGPATHVAPTQSKENARPPVPTPAPIPANPYLESGTASSRPPVQPGSSAAQHHAPTMYSGQGYVAPPGVPSNPYLPSTGRPPLDAYNRPLVDVSYRPTQGYTSQPPQEYNVPANRADFGPPRSPKKQDVPEVPVKTFLPGPGYGPRNQSQGLGVAFAQPDIPLENYVAVAPRPPLNQSSQVEGPSAGHMPQSYGQPVPQSYGPPAHQSYGPPAHQSYVPPAPQSYGPPAPQSYRRPLAPQNFRPPLTQQNAPTPESSSYGAPVTQGYGYAPPSRPPPHQAHMHAPPSRPPPPQNYGPAVGHYAPPSGPPPQTYFGSNVQHGHASHAPIQNYRPPLGPPPVPQRPPNVPQQVPMGHYQPQPSSRTEGQYPRAQYVPPIATYPPQTQYAVYPGQSESRPEYQDPSQQRPPGPPMTSQPSYMYPSGQDAQMNGHGRPPYQPGPHSGYDPRQYPNYGPPPPQMYGQQRPGPHSKSRSLMD